MDAKYKIKFLPVLVSLTYWVCVVCLDVNILNHTIVLFTVISVIFPKAYRLPGQKSNRPRYN